MPDQILQQNGRLKPSLGQRSLIRVDTLIRLRWYAIIGQAGAVIIIAMGFEIRILWGGESGDIPLSMWIIIITYLLALFLGLAKRRDDVLLAAQGNKVRKSIRGYNLEFINGGMMIMASVLIVAYISYTVSREVQLKFDSEYLYITVLFVIMGIFRYMQITFVEKRSGNPSKILLTDPFLQITILCWVITFIILIY